MALNTSIRGLQIKDAFFGVGIKRNAGDGDIAELALTELSSAVVDVSADSIAIVDANDSNASRKEAIADLVTAMAGTGLTASAGVLSVDTITDNIVEADIKVENLSAEIDESGYAGEHTLAETPIDNSVQIFLNGLMQEEGSGKDYTISGATFTFAIQPESGDILIVHYIQDN